MHVIIKIAGPSLPLIMRRKEKTYGICAKRDMVVFGRCTHLLYRCRDNRKLGTGAKQEGGYATGHLSAGPYGQ